MGVKTGRDLLLDAVTTWSQDNSPEVRGMADALSLFLQDEEVFYGTDLDTKFVTLSDVSDLASGAVVDKEEADPANAKKKRNALLANKVILGRAHTTHTQHYFPYPLTTRTQRTLS